MKSTMLVAAALMAGLALPLCAGSEGGTPCTGSGHARITGAEAAEIREHARLVADAIRESHRIMEEVNEREATKYNKLTAPVGPVKDRFGDPMYTYYGPRAYVGTPLYSGPRYAASFDRPYPPLVPDAVNRSYARGAAGAVYSAGMHTGGYLGVGASHSYFQSGMMMNPVSQAPSGTRAMENNH